MPQRNFNGTLLPVCHLCKQKTFTPKEWTRLCEEIMSPTLQPNQVHIVRDVHVQAVKTRGENAEVQRGIYSARHAPHN
eukprot:2557923-Rhodomonas_salina.2